MGEMTKYLRKDLAKALDVELNIFKQRHSIHTITKSIAK